MLTALGRLEPVDGVRASGRNRRVSPIALNPDEGLLTEPTPAVRSWSRERVFMPLKSHSWPRPRMIGSNRGADIRTRPAKVLLSGSRQPVEERLCLSKIGGSAAFGKPAINRCEKVAGFGAAALVVAEPG